MVDYSMYSGTLTASHGHPSANEPSKLKQQEMAKNYDPSSVYRNQSQSQQQQQQSQSQNQNQDHSSGRRHVSPDAQRTPDLRSDPNHTDYFPAMGNNMRFEMMAGNNSLHYQDMLYQNPGYNPSYPPFDSSSSMNSSFMDQSQFGIPSSVPFLRMEEDNEVRGRAENWHYAETKQFVNILLNHRHELADLRRHAGVWETVASELQAYGYDRSVDKCKNRWKVLVAKYKKYTEKSFKNKPRQASVPPSQIKMPGFMANDHHPGLAINYHYYHTTRASNPHAGTGGFEFYAEMHELLQHIYSHGPDGLVKRRTPLIQTSLPMSGPLPYSQPSSAPQSTSLPQPTSSSFGPSTTTSAPSHPPLPLTHSPHSHPPTQPNFSLPDLTPTLGYPLHSLPPHPTSFPSQLLSLSNPTSFKSPFPQYRESAL